MVESESTTRAALLADNDPISLLGRLPNTVFPMRVKVHLPRVRDYDKPDETFSGPDRPVDLQQPRGPYIPETTVHIDNPARRPPDGTTVWRVSEVRDELAELHAHIEETITDPGALRIVALDLAEIPPHFVTTDPETGELCAKSDLYEKRGNLQMARFQKEGSLAATEVRDQIKESLPGESRVPIRLTRVVEAQAKPSRHGRDTTGASGRARYFTEKDAEAIGEIELTPAVYQLAAASDPGDRTRPLSPVLTHLGDLLPGLSECGADGTGSDDELVTTVKFVGEERERTVFHASEVVR